jgi:hypothetical protein
MTLAQREDRDRPKETERACDKERDRERPVDALDQRLVGALGELVVGRRALGVVADARRRLVERTP